MKMHFTKLIMIFSIFLVVSATEETTKNRDKRQQVTYHPRRGGRPPPYAVQMEPTIRYSQRDPLYNPLANPKSDDNYEEPLYNLYNSDPEPIIEIIIKESNESLPTPVPPVIPSVRPKKEPIQVFYVKYEKKDQGDGKSKVIYDKPVPALNPHEEHEEITTDEQNDEQKEQISYVTPAPSKEPTTTLRAIIRPESESYHAGGSGIRVTFGTEQLPPNNHNKRSDLEGPKKPTPSTSKRQHGPFPPPPPPPPSNHHRVPPAFPQQRIVNSFPHQQLPPNFSPQQQFQSQRFQRPPITIQGLPDVQQRLPFQNFNSPHQIAINHPQQPGFPPALSVSHQNVHLQNQAPQFSHSSQKFRDDAYHQQQVQLYRQQEEEKFKRQQALQRQQQELQRQKIELQHRQQEQFQRLKQQENKIREQQQFNNQQTNYQQNSQQILLNNRLPQQSSSTLHRDEPKQSEILKAVPKLEQHYAIRENPHHPGPFPPNPQQISLQFPQNSQNNFQQQLNTRGIQSQTSNHGNYVSSTSAPLLPTPSPTTNNNNNQQFFTQNLGVPQQHKSSLASVWGRPVFKDNKQKIYATPVTHTSFSPSSTQRPLLPNTVSTTTPTPTTTTTTTQSPTTPRNEARIKENIANLPDEVPDDIRDQLLNSGILGNADIQVLDYDKVGDIPIENLPPEALANFYGAGGGGVVAASEPVPSIAKNPKINGASLTSPKKVTSKVEQATLKPGGVEMKVVRFDPNTAQGQAIADQHIREDATHLKPVTVGSRNDGQYNRYLPLKVSGTSFPIPDVPELKDRKISSVVVLAPVHYNPQDGDQDEQINRQSRKFDDPMPVKFLAGDSLKQLIKKPTAENYKKWLEQESRTEPQKQSVVLLVTTDKNQQNGDKEIFMYDVTTQTVSKLSGDLSSAFVDAAESNADSHDTIDDSSFTH